MEECVHGGNSGTNNETIDHLIFWVCQMKWHVQLSNKEHHVQVISIWDVFGVHVQPPLGVTQPRLKHVGITLQRSATTKLLGPVGLSRQAIAQELIDVVDPARTEECLGKWKGLEFFFPRTVENTPPAANGLLMFIRSSVGLITVSIGSGWLK